MHRSVRPLYLLAALVAGPAILAACSTSPSGTSAVAKASTLALPSGVVNAKDVPEAVPNDTSLRKSVALTACGQAPGGWRASGTATNHGAKPADFTVTVFFATPRDTVIGTGDARVHIDAGAIATWNVTGKFTAAPGTQCILRGVG